MLDQNVIANQTKLREEISEIKQYLSSLEREINSPSNIARLSDGQVIDMWKRLRTINNFTCNARFFWKKYTNGLFGGGGKYTNDEELVKRLANGVAMELEKGKE